jgi:hypothetical protein
MSIQVNKAVEALKENSLGFYKKISLSDSGKTSHQGGIYVHKSFAKVLFDDMGKKGSNKDRLANIDWYDGKKSILCRFCYYGRGTRNEYRITRFSRPFKEGQFIVVVKISDDNYQGFLLEEEDISTFYSKL